MYETREQAPLSRPHFRRRMMLHLLAALAFAVGSLLVGMEGYVSFEHLEWRDAFLNAAMLLGGMGPVESPQTPGGKIFAGAYALYSGLAFLVATSIVLAPVVHRFLHVFHCDAEE